MSDQRQAKDHKLSKNRECEDQASPTSRGMYVSAKMMTPTCRPHPRPRRSNPQPARATTDRQTTTAARENASSDKGAFFRTRGDDEHDDHDDRGQEYTRPTHTAGKKTRTPRSKTLPEHTRMRFLGPVLPRQGGKFRKALGMGKLLGRKSQTNADKSAVFPPVPTPAALSGRFRP